MLFEIFLDLKRLSNISSIKIYLCSSLILEFSNSSNFLDESNVSVKFTKFIKWVNALDSLKILIGLSLLISEIIILNLFLLFIFLTFAFESSLIFSTKLKKFCPSCFLITLPSISPRYLASSLCDLVGIPS